MKSSQRVRLAELAGNQMLFLGEGSSNAESG